MYSLSSVLPQWTGFASRNEGGIVSEERKQVIRTQKEKGERVWGEKLTCKDSFPLGTVRHVFSASFYILAFPLLSVTFWSNMTWYKGLRSFNRSTNVPH